MPDLTTAVEVAAKAFYQEVVDYTGGAGKASIPAWEILTPTDKMIFREKILPIVTALSEAGLLKEDQS